MNISAAYNLNCPDLYRFFVLSLTADKETRKTDTTLDQLASFTGDKVRTFDSSSKNDSLVQRLEKSGEVSIEHIRAKSLNNSNGVKRIIYTFKEAIPTKYRRINREFVNLDLSIKIKGYLLKLFALADPYSYHVSHTATAIANEFKMAKATVKKYNDILLEKGILTLNGSTFDLHIESFLIDLPKKYSDKTELFIQNVEKSIKSMRDSNFPLPKSYNQYLAAKKDNFKAIKNMDYFMSYVVSGVPYRSKSKSNENKWDDIIL